MIKDLALNPKDVKVCKKHIEEIISYLIKLKKSDNYGR